MLTSLQLWRNLKPLDLNQNLLGGFVLIPLFQVCLFILMYFDSFGDFSLHFWFRIKCFFTKTSKVFQKQCWDFYVTRKYENWYDFLLFFRTFGKVKYLWWISICCQNLLSDWKAKAESWRAELLITKSRNLFLRNSIFSHFHVYLEPYFQWFVLKCEFFNCKIFENSNSFVNGYYFINYNIWQMYQPFWKCKHLSFQIWWQNYISTGGSI